MARGGDWINGAIGCAVSREPGITPAERLERILEPQHVGTPPRELHLLGRDRPGTKAVELPAAKRLDPVAPGLLHQPQGLGHQASRLAILDTLDR